MRLNFGHLLLISFLLAMQTSKKVVPIWFAEYDVEILNEPIIGDTIDYNKSNKEDFKFVFFDLRGKCYCERYINGKLYEKGNFDNSLDTLKRYVSGRSSNGRSSDTKVQEYFQPLKSGEWTIYKQKPVKEKYHLGVLTRSK